MELIAEFLASPQQSLRLIRRQQPWLLAFLVLFVVILTQWITEALTVGQGWGNLSLLPLSGSFVSKAIVLFLLAASIHLAAGLLGGNGAFGDFFVLLVLCQLPQLLNLPLALLARASGQTFFMPVLSFLLGLWALSLYVQSLKANYRLSQGKTLLAAVSPLAFFGLALLVPLLLLLLAGMGMALVFISKAL